MPVFQRNDAERIDALLERMTPVEDPRSFHELLEARSREPGPFVVSFLNAHAVNLACRDEALARALCESDLLLRDGTGLKILCAALGFEAGHNMNGTDLIPRLIRHLSGARVAVCGTDEPYLSEASSEIPNTVLTMDGLQPPEDYVQAIQSADVDLVLLCMGMPKQEKVAQLLKRSLRRNVIIINGGAVLDFMAGRFPRAPRWMRSRGLEWSYRLYREPRRLWRRYLLGNAVFLARLPMLRARALSPATQAARN